MIKTKKAKLLKIKSAISNFIINTQKIVKSVEPSAEIIMLSAPQKRPRSPAPDSQKSLPKIIIPEYRKIKKSEISDNDSSENTDDEHYEDSHKGKEKLEILLRTCPELCKIKGNSLSTRGIHSKGLTLKNLYMSLEFVEDRIRDRRQSYTGEAVKRMKWPFNEEESDLEVKFT